MDKEQMKKIIDSPPEYDESKEVTMRSWLGDFYSKKMRLVMLNVFVCYLICTVLIIFSAVKFFRTEQVQYQIMHAVIVVCGNLWLGFVSVFAWVMMQRPSISRKINRLELCIAELIETIKEK
jgi:hypothetical protein